MPPEISATAPAGHLHEPFLERASQDGGSDGQYALAGFLTLRLVDQFSVGRKPHPDALAYQCSATREFLAEFDPPSVEVNHLLEVARVADAVRDRLGSTRTLWPPLLAFAFWLEQELRLDEALDVLDTAIRLTGEQEGEDEVQGWLQRGRVLRRSGRFEEAMRSYRTAGELAAATGDRHSELLSRIGRGIVSLRVGNLPEARELLSTALHDAQASGDRDGEARASHDLANVMDALGRTAEGVQLVFQAFRLYDHPRHKLRALGDLGTLFKKLGYLQAAENAFAALVRSPHAVREMRVNAYLELIETAVRRGDRLAFERYRREVRSEADATPYLAADFNLKVGEGFARFGKPERAKRHLRRALECAERHGINQYTFLAEQALDRLAGEAEPQPLPRGEPVPVEPSTALDRVADHMEEILAGAELEI